MANEIQGLSAAGTSGSVFDTSNFITAPLTPTFRDVSIVPHDLYYKLPCKFWEDWGSISGQGTVSSGQMVTLCFKGDSEPESILSISFTISSTCKTQIKLTISKPKYRSIGLPSPFHQVPMTLHWVLRKAGTGQFSFLVNGVSVPLIPLSMSKTKLDSFSAIFLTVIGIENQANMNITLKSIGLGSGSTIPILPPDQVLIDAEEEKPQIKEEELRD